MVAAPEVVSWALAAVPAPDKVPFKVRVPVLSCRSPTETEPPVKWTDPAVTLQPRLVKSILAPLLDATPLPTKAISPVTLTVPDEPGSQVMIEAPVPVDVEVTIAAAL